MSVASPNPQMSPHSAKRRKLAVILAAAGTMALFSDMARADDPTIIAPQ